MAAATSTARSTRSDGELTVVDPRAPRIGQTITASGLLLGVVLQAPVFVYAIALILNTAVWSRWKVHPYSLVWKHVAGPALDASEEPEPVAPHRFATLLGAVGTGLASLALLAGFPLVGYALAVAILLPAALGATTGFCLGCHMYQSVALFRRLSIV